MFRKFHDEHPSDAPTDEEDETSADDRRLLRQAGPDARRPLTRSSIKPKLLFQAEIKQRKLDNGEVTEDEDEDEEVTTDVETPIATPSRGKAKMMMRVDDSLQAATPPPTARKAKRGMLRILLLARIVLTLNRDIVRLLDPSQVRAQLQQLLARQAQRQPASARGGQEGSQ